MAGALGRCAAAVLYTKRRNDLDVGIYNMIQIMSMTSDGLSRIIRYTKRRNTPDVRIYNMI